MLKNGKCEDGCELASCAALERAPLTANTWVFVRGVPEGEVGERSKACDSKSYASDVASCPSGMGCAKASVPEVKK